MSINEQERSYRRGVVLGLTLAEVIVLVVFCLLLLFAISWKLKSDPSAANTGSEQSRVLQEVAKYFEERRGRKPLDEFWREVRWSYEEAAARTDTKANDRSDEQKIRDVIADMEASRGDKTLVEHWRDLKWSNKELQAKQQAIERLVEEKRLADQKLAEAIKKIEAARGEQIAQESKVAKSERAKAEAEAALAKAGHTWPPIIRLTDADGFFFRTGDAQLSKDFEGKLSNNIVPAILEYAKKYSVDVIEIVGHTDEQYVQPRPSNLDLWLVKYLSRESTPPLVANDNAGLGMARAAAVTRYLISDKRLDGYKKYPLSSGQVLDVSGKLSDGKNVGDVRERRRIEIRLRRSDQTGQQ